MIRRGGRSFGISSDRPSVRPGPETLAETRLKPRGRRATRSARKRGPYVSSACDTTDADSPANAMSDSARSLSAIFWRSSAKAFWSNGTASPSSKARAGVAPRRRLFSSVARRAIPPACRLRQPHCSSSPRLRPPAYRSRRWRPFAPRSGGGAGKGKREGRGPREARQPAPDAPRPVTDDAVPVGPTAPPAQVAEAIPEGGAAAVPQVARDQLEDLGAAPLAHQRFGRVAEVARMPEVERQARGREVELLVPPLARSPAGLIGVDHGQERRQRLEDPAVAFRDRAALLLPREAGHADGAPDAEPAGRQAVAERHRHAVRARRDGDRHVVSRPGSEDQEVGTNGRSETRGQELLEIERAPQGRLTPVGWHA